MSTNSVPLSAANQLVLERRSVTAAHGSSGNVMSYSPATSQVKISNTEPQYAVEFKVDSGEWAEIPAGANTTLDVDLLTQVLRVRRTRHAPASLQIQLSIATVPSGLSTSNGAASIPNLLLLANPASLPDPAEGYERLFIDSATGSLATIDEDRNIRFLGSSVPVNADGGIADRTTLLQDAITQAAAATAGAYFPTRALNRPTVTLPPGEFRFTSSLTGIRPGMRFIGAGKFATTLYFDNAADVAAFEIGTPATSVTDVFSPPGAVQNVEFESLSIRRLWNEATPNDTGQAGSRTGHGIRQTGGGGLRLRNVSISGFKYGLNTPCGGDFTDIDSSVDVEYCDVGMYFGPGSQQIALIKTNFFRCVECLVLDRVASIVMVGPIFNSPAVAGLVIESITNTSTRQLTSFSVTGTSLQQSIMLLNPWFEGGAGGVTADIPTHFVQFNLNTAETVRGLTIRDARVFALAGPKTTTSLVGSIGSVAPQRVLLDGAVFSGTMTNIFFNPGAGSTVRGWITESGYTQPAIANTAATTVLWEMLNGSTKDTRVGLSPRYEEFSSFDQTQGVRVEYDFTGGNGVIRYAFRNAGSWLTRFTIDIQNRRFYAGIDGGAPGPSTDWGTAAPTTGTWATGSIRWNSATGTGIPVGWKQTGATGTPGTWTAMPNI